MKTRAIQQHEPGEVGMDGALGAKMRTLLGPDDGASCSQMRHFELAPGGHTPRHHHDFENEVWILSGHGTAYSGQGDHPFKAGDVIFVPAGREHQFVNDGDEPCTFICVIPAPRERCTLGVGTPF